MRLLLDTHVWLWSLLAPDRLSARVASELRSPDNELWLSPISVWEAMLLVDRGRLAIDEPVVRWIERAVGATPRREAPLTHEVAVQSRLLSLPQRDPADRFLAATAKVYGLTLVTADDQLLHSGEFAVLANR